MVKINMDKLISVLLCILLATVSLAGCLGDSDNETSEDTDNSENPNNQTDNNTDDEVRNYTVPAIWEVVDLNNTTFTNGAIENAKCGLIFAWPAWDGDAVAQIETLRNSILENREGEIIHVWSAIYEDSTQEVTIANIHNFLFADDKATNHTLYFAGHSFSCRMSWR